MNVLFRRGDQTFIDENVPLNDGQIIFNETDEAIYIDSMINGTVVRKRYGGGNLSRSDIDMAFSTTSENPIANKVVTNAIGNLSSLQTDAKTNLVSAINEVDGHVDTNTTNIGILSSLTTTDKTSTVDAINEVNTKISKTEVLISNSGDAYDPTRPYKVGDLCIYNNKFYRCTTACSAGSWATNQSCFTQDTLTGATNKATVTKSLAVTKLYTNFYTEPTLLKSGNVCELTFSIISDNSTMLTPGINNLIRLPNEAIPSTRKTVPITFTNGQTIIRGYSIVEIELDGLVHLLFPSEITTDFIYTALTLTWII